MIPDPPAEGEEKREPGPRVDVLLDDVGNTLKQQEEDEKAAAAEAEARKKAELEAKARREAAAAEGDDPRITALREALRISEDARKRQQELAAPATPVVEPPKKLTREELNELYQKDPLAAIAMMQEEAVRTVSENLERRLMPLVAGGASSAKDSARARHPEAFEVFGADIDDYISKMPDKSVLNRPEAWDDLVAWIQGKNLDRLMKHREDKNKNKAADEARERERLAAGAHTRSERRPPPPAGSEELDDVEREIAKTLGMDPKDYKKWGKVGTI